jgi:hypothetical protein
MPVEEVGMKKIFLIFSVVLLVAGIAATQAKADGTDYSITGSYAPGTINDGLCAPNQTFSIDFTLPTQVGPMLNSYIAGDDFYVYPVSATLSMGNDPVQTGQVLLGFYETTSRWQNGGFFVNYCPDDASCATGTNYQWAFSGPQMYSGPESDPTMTPLGYTFTNESFIIFQDIYTEYDSTICGNVNVAPVPTPEPSVLVLLLAGLGVVALMLRKQSLGAGRLVVS